MKKIVKNFTKIVSAAVVLSLISASFCLAFANDEWTKYEPCNELSIPQDVLGSEIICAKTTKHGPAVIWSPEELSEEAQTEVWDTFKGLPGAGNPKGVLYISGETSCEYGMTVIPSEGKIVFDDPSNWALIYAGPLFRAEDAEIPEEPVEEPEVREEPEEPAEEPEVQEEPEKPAEEPEEEPEIQEKPDEEDEPAEIPEPVDGILGGGQIIPDYVPEEVPEVLPEPVPQPDIEPNDYVMILDPAPAPVYDAPVVMMLMADSAEIMPAAEAAEEHVLDVQPKTGVDDCFGAARRSILPVRYYVCLAAAAAALAGLIAAAIFIFGKKEWKNVK